MYAIYDCAGCVVLTFTLSTLLFGLCTVLLTIEWGIESLVRTKFSSMVRTFSQDHPFVIRGTSPFSASMDYRSPVLVATSDAMIRDSHVQSRRPSLS
jgi:hypothetical protein